MPVKIIYKSQPTAKQGPIDLEKNDYFAVNGVILPKSKGGDATDKSLASKYLKARTHEGKLLIKCEKLAKVNATAFKQAAKTYLSSKRCLWIALFEVNRKRPLEKRKSLEELSELASKYDILKDLSEPALVWQQPKASGNGMRAICSFETVARAAQLMVKKLLRQTYQPRDFQFDELTFAEKVQQAMKTINEKGYDYIVEIDIKDFYPSFTAEALIEALPFANEATRQIVLSANATWKPHKDYTQYGYIPSPPGIPQGSASSTPVADWCIANMQLENLAGVEIINHADNFFVIAKSPDAAMDAAKALSSGIAGLPGGDFIGKIEQFTTVSDGFRMLGCHVSLSKSGTLEVSPTETNLAEFSKRAGKQLQRVNGRLTAAAQKQSKRLRVMGVQDYLRFESMCRGWVQAFAFCGSMIDCIKDKYEYDMALLRHTFEITDEELKELQDHSTQVKVRWYSGQ